MRRVRYVVAMSLDGYIAGPNGEVDWIIMDPTSTSGRSSSSSTPFLWDAARSRTWEEQGRAVGSADDRLLTYAAPR